MRFTASFLTVVCLYLASFVLNTGSAALAFSQISNKPYNSERSKDLDALAMDYVTLALAFGQHDEDYVDAYLGPPEWMESAEQTLLTLDDLQIRAEQLYAALQSHMPADDETERHAMLQGIVRAMIARMRMLQGETLSFDEETRLIYDVVAPDYDIAIFDAALEALDAALPGEGPAISRMEALRDAVTVPEEKIAAVMTAATEECRARTRAHYDLPASEMFQLELVTDKPWPAYNWYKGDYKSLIQVNLDHPFNISRALDLACHEGYPGHHVANLYLDRYRLREKGWVEYNVFPLFSPMAFFMEGSANYGLTLAFPEKERIAFERDVLFPLAGIDPALAQTGSDVNAAWKVLEQAGIYIARAYLNGDISREEAIALHGKYALSEPERSERVLLWIDTYRSYIVNYTLGEQMISDYIDARAETLEDRWQVFEDLLHRPLSASDILVQTD